MLQRQSKNNDLVIQLEGAGIRKVEYYTDGLYKYETTASGTIYIPSSELKKMNDGQLKRPLNCGHILRNSSVKNPEIYENPSLEFGIVTWDNGNIDCSPEYMFENSFEYNVDEIVVA